VDGSSIAINDAPDFDSASVLHGDDEGNITRIVTAGDTNEDLVYLEILLNGVSRVCLCDTGIQRSLIPFRLVGSLTIEPSTVKVANANGIIVKTLGSSQATIQIGDDRPTEYTFIVTKHTNIPVLGMDWMTDNATGWDFEKEHMHIQGRDVKLQSAASVKACRKLVLARRSIVAPWSQAIVEGRVEINDLKL